VAERRYDLGIDTASDDISLALLDGDRVVAEHAGRVASTVSRELLGVIDAFLAGAGVARDEVARIAVCVGPGQYGGLRAGIATAQGLALGLGVPLAGVGRLEADAWPHLREGGPVVIAVHDAGTEAVAWAGYAPGAGGGVPSVYAEPRITRPADVVRDAPQPSAWVGEVSEALRETRDIASRGGDTDARALPRAAHLVRIARARGLFGDPGAVDAVYLRPPSITPPRQR
jgi:tRNA threonylcarbamoyladenosine biosynthesis protein TsaB